MEIIPVYLAVTIPVTMEMKTVQWHRCVTQFRDMYAQQINLYIKSVSLRRMLIAKMTFILNILLPPDKKLDAVLLLH
jgi:hypothetical protein